MLFKELSPVVSIVKALEPSHALHLAYRSCPFIDAPVRWLIVEGTVVKEGAGLPYDVDRMHRLDRDIIETEKDRRMFVVPQSCPASSFYTQQGFEYVKYWPDNGYGYTLMVRNEPWGAVRIYDNGQVWERSLEHPEYRQVTIWKGSQDVKEA